MVNIVTPHRSGRIGFVDERTVVYVPDRATTADARQALRDVYHAGILRPKPDKPGETERVYPLDYWPTDDPDRWIIPMRNDGAEYFEAELFVVYRGHRDLTFHSRDDEWAYLIDHFTRERSRATFDGTYPPRQT